MFTLDEQVYRAHGDAWQAQGRLRERWGGGALELAGTRLSSSGLPHAQWNSGDLLDRTQFDLAEVRAWFASRAHGAGVPWGMRVPAGEPFEFGRWLFAKRCMALVPARFVASSAPHGVTMALATRDDVDHVVAVDAAAFEAPVEQNRGWVAPHVGARGFSVAVARAGGAIVGTAIAIHTDDRAGRCAGIFGVAVVEAARRRGIGAAQTSWLVQRAFEGGATLVHLNPNTEEAARVYARLGFAETRGFDVYVDL